MPRPQRRSKSTITKKPGTRQAMTAIREFPLGWIIATSAIGCALPKLLHISLPETGFPEASVYATIFSVVFGLQAGAFVLYAVLIYPFFTSPFRHLRSPKGGLPLFGHGRDLRLYGPGHMARQWYANPAFAEQPTFCHMKLTSGSGTRKMTMTASCASFGMAIKNSFLSARSMPLPKSS